MTNNLIKLGSETAKNGFKNEDDVIKKFNNWKIDKIAQQWLLSMNYKLKEIEYVQAIKIKGSFKADIQVQIKIIIKLKEEIDAQNIQVKLVSNDKGFNQIDKRWIVKYIELWDIPQDISRLLKYYTGEILPYKKNTRDKRRMHADEFTENEKEKLIAFLTKNKTLIISDIIKGRGKYAAEWMLVIKKFDSYEWVLKPINIVLNYFSDGIIEISKKGTFKIAKITMQRKGGDGGRDTAKMLQFKINPAELFNIK